jgi:hypothetical protein
MSENATLDVKSVLGSMKGIGAKERPRCRKKIIDHQLKPFVGACGYWEGFQAITPNGRKPFLSDGMERQMTKMAREGFWPELLDPELNRRALAARRDDQREARALRKELWGPERY